MLALITLLPVTNLGYQMALDMALSGGVETILLTFYYIAWAVCLLGTAYFGIFVFRTTLAYLTEGMKRPHKRTSSGRLIVALTSVALALRSSRYCWYG